MCTAITYQTKQLYFGRTLDYECSYGEQVTITPRNYPFDFRHAGPLHAHYAIIGMAHVADNYPLFYDAVNETGLCIAGLNFVGNADIMMVMRLDRPEQLSAYLQHPKHVALAQSLKDVVAARMSFDAE